MGIRVGTDRQKQWICRCLFHLRQERIKRRNTLPLAVVITDGLPTVALRPGGDPLKDLLSEARVIRRQRITTIVVDSADQSAKLGGCGLEVALAAGGQWLAFDELAASTAGAQRM